MRYKRLRDYKRDVSGIGLRKRGTISYRLRDTIGA